MAAREATAVRRFVIVCASIPTLPGPCCSTSRRRLLATPHLIILHSSCLYPKPFNPFLQAGVAAAEKHRWLRLDVDKPLGEALRSLWLVEFPLVHVALPGTAPGRRGPSLRF